MEALRSLQRKMWLAAMQREKDCHTKNGTFGDEMDCVKRQPPDRKPIPADWVFKVKHRGGPIEVDKLEAKQFKARVVIRGQFMKAGLDYNDTFAPVAKPATVRSVFAYATANGYFLKTGDVETAFLTADMDCEVWVRLPPYWGDASGPINPSSSTSKPYLLKKGIPGIPQGSRLFHETFSAFLITMGFKPSDADKCLFIKYVGLELVIILLWVDDFIIAFQLESTYESFMRQLRTKFTVPASDTLKAFLGMEIVYDPQARIMKINQAHTITVLLERAKMLDCNPASTPCPAGAAFTKEDCPTDPAANATTTEYRSLIALANFVSCWTRPDVTYTVNNLCKFMANPGEVHWKLFKHLLRYLKGTRTTGLHYEFPAGPSKLLGYTDSSFADCPDTGRSTLAYVFFFGNAILSWYSKKNTYVTTCTNHSEYSALALGCKEAEWLVLLFKQLDKGTPHTPVPVYVDNSGMVSMVLNPVDHAANKHVKISCHYTRELAENRVVAPVRVPTERNIADVFTKALPLQRFTSLTNAIPMLPVQETHATPTTIMVTQALPTTATVLMVHTYNQGESVLEQDEDSTEPVQGEANEADACDEPEEVESKTGRPPSDFMLNFPTVAIMKGLLGATSYDIHRTDRTFSTGRKKLEVVFYRDAYNGRAEISRHDAMELRGPYGKYIAVHRQPNVPVGPPLILDSPAPAIQYNPAQPLLQDALTPAIIHVTQPSPQLRCCKCGTISTIAKALLECSCCNAKAFEWSCACVPRPRIVPLAPVQDRDAYNTPPRPSRGSAQAPPQAPFHPSSSSSSGAHLPGEHAIPMTISSTTPTPQSHASAATPLKRSARVPTCRRFTSDNKQWVEAIKYAPPVGRYTQYHKIQCPVLGAADGAVTASIEFANAQRMKPAPCCHSDN